MDEDRIVSVTVYRMSSIDEASITINLTVSGPPESPEISRIINEAMERIFAQE